jgi:hypothetical protein
MFTIKYQTFSLSPTQPADAPGSFYDRSEQIHGPFAMVSQEYKEGYSVVYCHRTEDALGMTFGPFIPPEQGDGGSRHPRPTLWVMNEQGATIAKYDL